MPRQYKECQLKYAVIDIPDHRGKSCLQVTCSLAVLRDTQNIHSYSYKEYNGYAHYLAIYKDILNIHF